MNTQQNTVPADAVEQEDTDIPMWIWGATAFIAAYLITTLIGGMA